MNPYTKFFEYISRFVSFIFTTVIFVCGFYFILYYNYWVVKEAFEFYSYIFSFFWSALQYVFSFVEGR